MRYICHMCYRSEPTIIVDLMGVLMDGRVLAVWL